MAKIAVLFALVALIAICNGARIAREAPPAPANIPEILKPLVDEVQKFFSEENLAKVKSQGEKLQQESEKLGTAVSNDFKKWFESLQKDLTDKAPK